MEGASRVSGREWCGRVEGASTCDPRLRRALLKKNGTYRTASFAGEVMVRRIYGHLGEVRHRSEHVEYRIEQHREKLKEPLASLRALQRQEEAEHKRIEADRETRAAQRNKRELAR